MKAAIANAVATYSAARTYAQAAGAWRDQDTETIERQQREIARLTSSLDKVTTDRDELLQLLERITDTLGLPHGVDSDKLIQRIEEIA